MKTKTETKKMMMMMMGTQTKNRTQHLKTMKKSKMMRITTMIMQQNRQVIIRATKTMLTLTKTKTRSLLKAIVVSRRSELPLATPKMQIAVLLAIHFPRRHPIALDSWILGKHQRHFVRQNRDCPATARQMLLLLVVWTVGKHTLPINV